MDEIELFEQDLSDFTLGEVLWALCDSEEQAHNRQYGELMSKGKAWSLALENQYIMKVGAYMGGNKVVMFNEVWRKGKEINV